MIQFHWLQFFDFFITYMQFPNRNLLGFLSE